MNTLYNKVLNKILGVRRRYRSQMDCHDSTQFMPNFSILGKGKKVKIGKRSILGVNVILENSNAEVKIGDNVYIGNSKIICKQKVVLGNNILIAWGVTIYDHDSHSVIIEDRRNDIFQTYTDFINEKGNYLKNKNWEIVNSNPIIIEDDVWLGMESLILKGVTVGEGSIVAARSVVTKDVAPYTIVAGNPAKEVKKLKQ